MTEKILTIGNNPTDSFNLIGIAKGSYVLARTALNYPMAMFSFLPTSIHLIHHSIETYIKAFLVNESIKYPFGKKGHILTDLIELGYKKSAKLSFFYDKILCRSNFKKLLIELDYTYNNNRYSFAGYSIKTDELIDLFDEIIYIFLENFCLLINREYKEIDNLWQIDIPEDFLYSMEYRQKQQFIFCIIPKHYN
ncbi:MAG: hypothetical protein WC850_01605 [Candidatus Gracilibacteria bacterium]